MIINWNSNGTLVTFWNLFTLTKGKVMVYAIVLRIKTILCDCVNKSKNSEDVVKFVCCVAFLVKINLNLAEVRFGC
jgi:hypothetical protein